MQLIKSRTWPRSHWPGRRQWNGDGWTSSLLGASDCPQGLSSPCLLVEQGNCANCSQGLQLDLGLQEQWSLVSCLPGGTLKASKVFGLPSAVSHAGLAGAATGAVEQQVRGFQAEQVWGNPPEPPVAGEAPENPLGMSSSPKRCAND